MLELLCFLVGLSFFIVVVVVVVVDFFRAPLVDIAKRLQLVFVRYFSIDLKNPWSPITVLRLRLASG